MIYLKLAEHMLEGDDKYVAYKKTREEILSLWDVIEFPITERKHFKRVIDNDVTELPKSQIRSGGYVIEALEASLWCFLNADSYQDAVLNAINLGQDTGTTAAISGGLAGLYYGSIGIPEDWLAPLARRKDIAHLGEKLSEKTGF